MYRYQDQSMRCGCCWCMAHWDGNDWHTDLFQRGVFRTLLFKNHVRRWRGVAAQEKP
jgi:hypothetical protein